MKECNLNLWYKVGVMKVMMVMMVLTMVGTEMPVIRTVTGTDGGGDGTHSTVVVIDSHSGHHDCHTAYSVSGFGSPNPPRASHTARPTFQQGASSFVATQLSMCPADQGQSHRSFLQLFDWQIFKYVEVRAWDHGCCYGYRM